MLEHGKHGTVGYRDLSTTVLGRFALCNEDTQQPLCLIVTEQSASCYKEI